MVLSFMTTLIYETIQIHKLYIQENFVNYEFSTKSLAPDGQRANLRSWALSAARNWTHTAPLE